jgi:hypothetical protein
MTREIRPYDRSIEEKRPEFVEAFEMELRSEGGRLLSRDGLLQWFCLRYWEYIQVFRSVPFYSPYLQRIHLDFVANDSLNALATKNKDVYLIGINAGTINNLVLYFSLLLSDPRVMTNIGDASKETRWINDLARCDWRLPLPSIIKGVSFRADPPVSYPIDTERRLYAHRLAILASDFVFFHELVHLAAGHLEFLSSKNNSMGVKELARGPLGHDPLDRQALEMNADAAAAKLMVQEWFDYPEQLAESYAFETVTQALESLALAVISVFLIFDPYTTAIDRYKHAAHPHPAVRLVNVSFMIMAAAENVSPEFRIRVEEAWNKGLEIAATICATMKIGSAIWHAVDKEMPVLRSEYDRIATHFRLIDKKLRPDIARRS